MRQYSVKPRSRKYLKGYGFLSFSRKQKKKQLLDTAGEFIGDKIADTVKRR